MNYPPGPSNALLGLNIIRNFGRDPLRYLTQLSETYSGDLIYYRLGPIDGYMVKSPELVYEVLVKQAKKFQKWSRQKEIFGKFDGDGLVNSDGDFWRRQRKLVQPAFHTQRLHRYADAMVSYTEQMVSSWQGQAVKFPIQHTMSDLTRKIVTKTLFNADVSAESDLIGEIIQILQEMAFREMRMPFSLPDWLPLPYKQRERDAIHTIDQIILRIIAERRESGADHGDLLSMLLMSKDESGQGITDPQARDEAMTLFIAGHETTATALAWTWYLIAKHPQVEARLIAEIDAIGNRPITFADLSHLSYTLMVFKEAMRLYPPTWMFPREAAEDLEIGGYRIKKGALIHIPVYQLHHNPRYFSEPEVFNPDRFSPECEDQIVPYAYFPFGGGPRVCIGNGFALMEAQLILATVLQKARLRLAPEQGEPELQPLIVLQPKGDLQMIAEPR